MSTLLTRRISFSLAAAFSHTVPRLPNCALRISATSTRGAVTSPWYTRKHDVYLRIFIEIWNLENGNWMSALGFRPYALMRIRSNPPREVVWMRIQTGSYYYS